MSVEFGEILAPLLRNDPRVSPSWNGAINLEGGCLIPTVRN